MLVHTLCLALLLCVSQHGAEPTATSTTAPASAPQAETKPAEAAATKDAPPKLELLSQGDEPRSLLRLKLEPGSKQIVAMRMNMQMKMGANGEEMPAGPRMPEFEAIMVLTVGDALPDGSWKYECEIVTFGGKPTEGVAPGMLTFLNGMLAEMNGMRIRATIDPRGAQRDISITSNITTPMLFQQVESMKQSMSQMSLLLPEQEVGINAKWVSELQMESSGIKVRQRQTYRVLEKSAEQIRCSVSTQQSAAEKNTELTNLPPGSTGTLVDLKGEGLGELVFALRHVMAESAKITVESIVNMDIAAQGVKTKMDMRTVLVTTLSPATLPAPQPSSENATTPAEAGSAKEETK